MTGLGTVINILGIIAGGICGLLFGRFLKESQQDSLGKACGICVIFLGIAGALEGMMSVEGSALVSGGSMMIIISVVLGTFIGELLGIERLFELLGKWLREKSGNAGDKKFVDGFVTSSLTVCIGAMAIIGAIEDGLFGDCSLLAAKAVLDFIIIMVMTCSLGKGCIFSALPVGLCQGTVTVFAGLLRPLMTDAALVNLSLVGSILIFCVGVNLVWGKKLNVANMLPGIVLAVIAAFI